MKGEAYKDFTEDGAWCFFADPRAVYFSGNHNRTYVGWLTKRGDVMLGSYDHKDGTISSVLIKESLQQDDHANPSIFIPSDGRVVIYYSAHNGQKMFNRAMEIAEDITSFGAECELPENTSGMFGYTYPNPVDVRKERQLYLFWRGGNFKPNFSVRPDGQAWSEPRTLIMGDGARPYIKFVGNGEDTIWFAFTDGHPNVEANNSIYCAYLKEGMVYHADGSAIKAISDLPMQPHDADVVFDGVARDTKAWIWDIALDRNERPIIVYAVFHSETDHRYWYSSWNGESWDSYEITAGGQWFPQTPEGAVERETYYSGGIILDHVDPSNVYLSRSVNAIFEIEHWHTADFGHTWTSTAITENSSRNNVRPFVTRNHEDESTLLLWMHGDYVHFTRYETSLKMKVITGV